MRARDRIGPHLLGGLPNYEKETQFLDQNAALTTAEALPEARRMTLALPRPGILLSLCAGEVVLLLLMYLLGPALSRLTSLWSVTVAAFCGLLLISALYVKRNYGTKGVLIVCCAFLLKVLVGVVHSLCFFDPHYFSNFGSFSYFWDFEWMDRMMQGLAVYWTDNGFSLPPATFYVNNKNPFLIAYNALLYYLSGVNYLNLAPWNALHSLYVALLVGALALESGATRVQARFALALVAFQPFGFISSVIWRDSVGQFWLILGVYLLIASREKKYLWILAFPAACFFAWSHRQPYLLAVAVLAIYLVYDSIFKPGQRVRTKLLLLGLLALALCSLPVLAGLALERFVGSDQMSIHPLLIPLRVLRAMAGPFPWYQVLMGVSDAIFMPVDFIQAVCNLTLWIIVLPVALRNWRETRRIDPCLLVGGMLFLMAVVAVGVHMPYISVGIVLLIPLACRVPQVRWLRTFLGCFYGFLFANILYAAMGLSGGGIVMGITGY